jgi:hypothetical protein
MLKRLILALVLALQVGAIIDMTLRPVPPPRCFPCDN